MENYPQPQPTQQRFRVFVIYDSGHTSLLESGCTIERAQQVKTALMSIFPEVRIEEMPPDFGRDVPQPPVA